MSEDGGTAQEASGEASSAPAEIASRPDFVPEKFWNAKSGEVRMEDAFKSYSEIEKKGRERSDTMRKSIIDEMSSEQSANVPHDGYEARIPESMQEYFGEDSEFQFNENDPLLNFWADFASEAGLDQEGFDKGVEAYLQANMSNQPDMETEFGRLGENGKERAGHVGSWAKQNFSEETYNALESFATNAEAVVALEEIMALAGEPKFAPFMKDTGSHATMMDAQQLQRTEAYWNENHPDHMRTQKKVEKMFQQLEGQRA